VQVLVAERLRPQVVIVPHSLMSAHVVPLNEYPAGQEQEYEPVAFVQVPTPQGAPLAHSLTSTHVVPFDV
jgi:hypothetical protein